MRNDKTHQHPLRLRDIAQWVGQIAVLWIVTWLSHRLVEALNIPVPGNVAAVLLMFLLLQTGVIPLPLVDKAATLLLRHLALFFLPIAVGLMTFATLWISSGLSILFTLIVSAGVGFAITGLLCQSFSRLLGKTEGERCAAKP
jgi:holin-like protein